MNLSNKFERFSRVWDHTRDSVARGRKYGQVSRADICIDDNRGMTCILRRSLMGEICFAIAFGQFYPISNFTEFTYLSPRLPYTTHHGVSCSRKPDKTIKYPSQLFRPVSRKIQIGINRWGALINWCKLSFANVKVTLISGITESHRLSLDLLMEVWKWRDYFCECRNFFILRYIIVINQSWNRRTIKRIGGFFYFQDRVF